jgi:plastocyanin
VIHRSGALGSLVVSVLLFGCGPQASSDAHGDVHITSADGGCEPAPATVQAGDVRVTAGHNGARTATIRLERAGEVLGEAPDVNIAVTEVFDGRLEPGEYEIVCVPSGDDGEAGLRTTLTVE